MEGMRWFRFHFFFENNGRVHLLRNESIKFVRRCYMTCIYIEHSDYTKERLVYHDISIHTIPIKYRDAHQNLNVAPCGIEILSMESFMWYVNICSVVAT